MLFQTLRVDLDARYAPTMLPFSPSLLTTVLSRTKTTFLLKYYLLPKEITNHKDSQAAAVAKYLQTLAADHMSKGLREWNILIIISSGTSSNDTPFPFVIIQLNSDNAPRLSLLRRRQVVKFG